MMSGWEAGVEILPATLSLREAGALSCHGEKSLLPSGPYRAFSQKEGTCLVPLLRFRRSLFQNGRTGYFSLDIPDRKEYRGLQSAIVEGRGSDLRNPVYRISEANKTGRPVCGSVRNLLWQNITFLKRLKDGRVLAGSEERGLYMLWTAISARHRLCSETAGQPPLPVRYLGGQPPRWLWEPTAGALYG